MNRLLVVGSKLMTILKTLMGAAVAALSIAPLTPIASAQNLLDLQVTEAGDSDVTKTITLGLNKSTIVNFNNPASDVYITNPGIADAAVQTDKRIVFRGVEIGETNAFVFDSAGNQMLNLEIRVEPDVTALSDLIKRHVPDARIKAEAVNSNVLLTGLVDSLSQSDAVIRLANAYLGASEDTEFGVINMMQIAAKDQVLLQVRIVEMQRTVIKQLGIDIGQESGIGRLQGERIVEQFPAAGTPPPGFEPFQVLEGAPPFAGNISAAATQAFSVAGLPIGGLALSGAFSNLLNGSDTQSQTTLNLQALERVGIVRTLAEPNLAALSGEPANFLVGGEFPVPVSQGTSGAVTVEFRPFGVGLGFTPIVLSEGRISLRLSTEISELTTAGSFSATAATVVGPDGELTSIPGLTIPALSVRRTETTVELPSGQSMMIAGLIDSSTRQSLDQVPGIRDVPILGALFRSRDFRNEETELVVIVTPYLVDPTAPSNLQTPDKGFANPSDAKTFLFGKLNRLYGKNETPANSDNYTAPVGFIEE